MSGKKLKNEKTDTRRKENNLNILQQDTEEKQKRIHPDHDGMGTRKLIFCLSHSSAQNWMIPFFSCCKILSHVFSSAHFSRKKSHQSSHHNSVHLSSIPIPVFSSFYYIISVIV